MYVHELLFAEKAGVVCPNRLIGLQIELGFSIRDFNEDAHMELSDLLCDFSDNMAHDRYKNLLNLGKLTIMKNPTILVGQRQSGTKITDLMFGVVTLKFSFN
jgi:hypothetical protein